MINSLHQEVMIISFIFGTYRVNSH